MNTDMGMRAGIAPAQTIRALIESGAIMLDGALLDRQIQPASLDLRLGKCAYRIRPGSPCANSWVTC
jgi:dCTP deaminase